MTRKTKLHEIRDYVIIALAMIEGSIGLNIFLLPNHITMGGVGGIASILCWGFGIPASVSYLALNVFLLLIAFRILGYKFCLKTIYGVGIFALTTRLIETAHVFDEAGKNIRQLYPKVLAEMSYIGENTKSDKVRESLIHFLAFTYVEGNGVENITDLQNLYYTYVTSPRLNEIFKKACAKWDKAAVGRPSPVFKGVDVNGKEMTLRDFRGKYIYIDMWATWCGPCQKELPFLKKLEEKFKGRNIVFVGLSIDQDKAKWAARVKSGTLSGTQLYIGKGSKFQSDYRISGIPRFILLDPNGRIVNPDMTRPSSEDTEKILNSQPGL